MYHRIARVILVGLFLGSFVVIGVCAVVAQ